MPQGSQLVYIVVQAAVSVPSSRGPARGSYKILVAGDQPEVVVGGPLRGAAGVGDEDDALAQQPYPGPLCHLALDQLQVYDRPLGPIHE